MLDIKFVRNNPEVVKQNIKNKFQDDKLPLVDEVIELDQRNREIKQEVEALRADKNQISKQIGACMAQGKKEEAEELKKKVQENAERVEALSKEEKENFSKEIIEDYNTTVKDTLQRLDVYKYLKDVVDINIYRLEEITLKDSFGDQIEQIGKDYPLLANQDKEALIKLSD